MMTLDEFVNNRATTKLRTKQHFINAQKEFERRGIKTITKLLAAYDCLANDIKFVSLLYFADRKARSAVNLCFRELRLPDLGGTAAMVLAEIGGSTITDRLLKLMARKSISSHVRYNALNALAKLRGVDDVRRATPTLIRACHDSKDSWLVSIAIDGLHGFYHELKSLPSLQREVVHCICESLDRNDPLVQGYAAFALGEIRQTNCLRQLEKLAKFGKGKVGGLGSIRRIARDAVRSIKSS
jgi:hypothetical protein